MPESPRPDRAKEERAPGILPKNGKDEIQNPDARKLDSQDRTKKMKQTEAEERDTIQRMEVQGIKDIHELIENADVPLEQKIAWKKLASLEIPRDATIKVVAMIGDPSFNQSAELPLITEALKALHPNVDIVHIDNKLPKNLKMAALQKELNSATHDVVIPYFSSHGSTRSAFGKATTVNAPDDNFVVNTGARKTRSEDISSRLFKMKVDLATDDMMKKYASDLIDPTTHQIKYIPPGSTFSVNDVTVTIKEPYYVKQEVEYRESDTANLPNAESSVLSERPTISGKFEKPKKFDAKVLQGRSEETLRTLFHQLVGSRLIDGPEDELSDPTAAFDWFGENITMGELAEIQKKAEKNLPPGKKQEWIYIFDNCYSGSAIDDEIAERKSTKAILTSSSETEKSGHDDDLYKGVFMKHLFQFMKDGLPIGEAFIRTDLLLEMERKRSPNPAFKTQNPKAGIRDGEKMIEVSSVEKLNKDRRIS